MDPKQLIDDGMVFAGKAISHDQRGEHQLAHFFYTEASEAILKAITLDSNFASTKSKAFQYEERAAVLQTIINNSKTISFFSITALIVRPYVSFLSQPNSKTISFFSITA